MTDALQAGLKKVSGLCGIAKLSRRPMDADRSADRIGGDVQPVVAPMCAEQQRFR